MCCTKKERLVAMRIKTMRSMVMALALVTVVACPASAAFVTVNDLSNIILWAGSGANEAGFVLQFGDSQAPTAIAWGYRWDGSASAEDMIFAIAGSVTGATPTPPAGLDSRLTIDVVEFPPFGFFVNTITYDQAGLPPEWSQVSRTIEDDFVGSGTYPAFYLNPGAGGTWSGPTMNLALSGLGMSDTVLADGGWYAFVQSDGSDPFAFTQPVSAVPEPGTWALVGGAAVAGLVIRRRARGLR